MPAHIAPTASIIDKMISDPKKRVAAKLQLIQLQGETGTRRIPNSLASNPGRNTVGRPVHPPHTARRFPIEICDNPMVAAARDFVISITNYLNGLPESLIGLFGTGHFGYTAVCQFGTTRRTDTYLPEE
jgi:hypothetical protein